MLVLNFSKPFFKEEAMYNCVSLSAPWCNFICETLPPANLTKNEQAKVQIFVGYLSNLGVNKLLLVGLHYYSVIAKYPQGV